VDVVVTLQDSALPPGLAKKAAIAQLQKGVLAALPLGLLKFRYSNLNGFSARLSGAQIAGLSHQAAVGFIEPMPVHQTTDLESDPITDTDLARADGYNGTGTVAVVIDDGLDAAHPAFTGSAGRVIAGYDFADNDANFGYDCAGQSHGTAVAGVALGNGGGVLGVAPEAKLIFLKVRATRAGR
jgi:subtilisin family serine protease